jgi:fibronectin-binding autotransporter adhesin
MFISLRRTALITAPCVLVLLLCVSDKIGRAATSTFVQQANNSSWNSASSWADGAITPVPTAGGGHIPNAAGDVAILQQRVTTNATMGASTTYTITLGNSTDTIGTLTINNDNNEYTTSITSGALVFDNAGSDAVLNENLGTGTSNTSRTRITVPVTLNSNLIVNQNHNLTRNTATEFTQQITASADKTITKQGLGSLQYAYGGASDGFLGTLDIKAGTVRLINGSGTVNTTFNKAKSIIVEDGTQFQLGNGITSFNLGTTATNPAITTPDGKAELLLNGLGSANTQSSFNDGALRFEESVGTNVTVTFNSPVHMQTTSKIYVTAADITAVLTEELRGDGSAGLVKGGSGLLKLSTTSANGNPYAGNTVISKGALAVNNTGSTASGVGSGNVNVNDTGNGAVLGGTGFIGKVGDASNVTLTGDSTNPGHAVLSPGNLTATTTAPNLTSSPGVLTIHGDLTFDANSALNVDITGATVGTQYDQVIADGAITLGGAGLNINLGSFTPTGSESFELFDNQGAGAISGVFGSINGVAGTYTEGAAVTLGSQTFHITYAGGTGNDVLLVGTPAGVAGDYNGNGVVDAADYVVWRKNLGLTGGATASQGDGDADGNVTPLDYDFWRARFGNASGSGSSLKPSAVPEPGTVLLLAFVLPTLASSAARRQHGRTRR